jgi:ceramide glucosyltransferase
LIAQIILAIALVGSISSTVVLILAVIGAIKFKRNGERERKAVERLSANLPPVSVLKPVHGNEARMKENIESFFRQNYPKYEILFAADEADDSALPIIREIAARYPHIHCEIFITGQPPWPNAPNYCFHRLTEVANYDILVTSDSDVEVDPNYLRYVVTPLLDPKVGALTTIFRGKSAGGFWADVDAIGMSVEFTAGVLVVNLLEGTKFGLGPTIALRKDSIGKIGGYAAVRDYLSNDFVVGNFIHKAGYDVVLSSHVVDHIAPRMGFRTMWERQLRWAMGTRYSRPKGHLGAGLTFAMPFGILGLIAAPFLGLTALGAGLFAAAWLNRVIECWVIGWWAARDPIAKKVALLYPLRDLHGFIIWCASYLSRRSLWRDNKYKLLKGGRLWATRANGSVIDPDSPDFWAEAPTAEEVLASAGRERS